MAMTYHDVRLTKCDGTATELGRQYDVEIEVDFTGAYDGAAATSLLSVTLTSDSSTWDTTIGAEISAGAGTYVMTRNVVLDPSTYAGDGGTFTIRLKYEESTNVFTENPLLRKDVASFRLDPYAKPIAKDRAGRIIATYRQFTSVHSDGTTSVDGDKPLELFATPPTVETYRVFASITGYRSTYMAALDSFGGSDDDDFAIVNNAPIVIDGVPIGKEQARIVSIATQRQKINGVSTVAHTWNLAIARRHDLRLANAGSVQWKDGKVQPIILKSSNTRIPQWPLDSSGLALAEGFSAGDVTYLTFATTLGYDFGIFNWRF